MEYKMFRCLMLLFTFNFYSYMPTDAKTCFFKEGSTINVTCVVSTSQSTSVLWQITELNLTTTLYNCTLSSCKLVNGSDIKLQATTKLDLTNSFIVSSSLDGQVDGISQKSSTSLRNLRCQTDNSSVNVCEQIQVYAEPKNITCSLTYIISNMIVAQCLVYPVIPMDIVNTPDLITRNVSTFISSIINDGCTQSSKDDAIKCEYIFNQSRMGAGQHKFSLTVSANVSDPNKTFVKSNSIDISLWDDIQYVVCFTPVADPNFSHSGLYTVKCLTPLPIGHVTCILNQKTNDNFLQYESLNRQVKYLPSQNILNTFALECQFRLLLSNFWPGQYQFQANVSKITSDGKVSFKTSNWTSPWILRDQSQINFTVNGSPIETILKENDSLSFHCSTDGMPTPTIKLYQGNLENYYMLNDGTDFNGTEISIPVTGCQQAGLYYCNSIGDLSGDYIKKNVSVKILCAQRLRSKYFQNGNEQYVGVFNNTNTLEIPVIGYPKPKSMTLSRQQEPTKTFIADGVFITYKEDYVSPYGKIVVVFTNEGIISKMTNFTLRVNNGIKEDTLFEFSIRARSSATSVGRQYRGILILCIIILHCMA